MSSTEDKNKVIIMHGFSHEEISKIMKLVKQQFENPRDLIFAMSTEQSLEMKLGALIEDMTEDHVYLQKNPPKRKV
ncbi:DUF3783 domain-containing protein [Spirochaeta dissipatitropha]